MARIRTVKPEFFTSEQIVECSTNARLLFIGMWCFCDDSGVHPASVKSLKMQIFPGDSFAVDEISDWISQLISAGLLEEYLVEEKLYWRVTGWNHQKIDRPHYKYPLADGSTPNRRVIVEDSTNDRRAIREGSTTSTPRNGMEIEKERKKESTVAAKAAIEPEGFLEFWELFPRQRRTDRKGALAAYRRALKENRATEEEIIRGVKAYQRSDEVHRNFAKSPEAWLNQNRWGVDYSATPTAERAPKKSTNREVTEDYLEQMGFDDARD